MVMVDYFLANPSFFMSINQSMEIWVKLHYSKNPENIMLTAGVLPSLKKSTLGPKTSVGMPVPPMPFLACFFFYIIG